MTVGDVLVLRFGAGTHTVVEFDKRNDWLNCDTGDPTSTEVCGSLGNANRGSARCRIPMEEVGVFYFGCSVLGHCSAGNMKLRVKVVAA